MKTSQWVRIAILILVGMLMVVLTACSKGNTPETNTIPQSNSSETIPDGDQQAVVEERPSESTPSIQMSNTPIKNFDADYMVYIPDNWSTHRYGTLNIASDWSQDEELYHLIVAGYSLLIYDPIPVDKTLDDLPEFLHMKLKEDTAFVINNDGGMEQDITDRQKVTVNGIDMLKVRGSLTSTSSDGNVDTTPYIGYYAFFSNEQRNRENVPIYLMMLVDSAEQADLDYAEKVLDEVVITIEEI